MVSAVKTLDVDDLRITRARIETFGATLATESPTAVVAVDRVLAGRLGLRGGVAWEGPATTPSELRALAGPNEVHVAVTDRCPAGCTSCYADALPDGHEPTFDELSERLHAIAAMGALSVAFGGGEAGLRDDLPALGALARALGMTPSVTTSGLGLDAERARAMRVFAQVNVSHDGVEGAYRAVRGFGGERLADRAVGLLRDAGVPVGVNTVLTRESFDRLEATAAHVEALGAVELQLVRLKPAGRGQLDYLARRLDPVRIEALPDTLERIARARTLGVRIDCALVPFVVREGMRGEDLVRLGVSGCEAGRSLLAVRSDGRTAGCSFTRTEDALGPLAWTDNPALERFRDHAAGAPEPCASCPVRAACRGGCRVVAGFVGGDPWGPDPECPRVRAHRVRGARETTDAEPSRRVP
jgi:radical SAM protein with 4Fe4S-binding SPASM domain